MTDKPSKISKPPPMSFKTRISISVLSAVTDFSRRSDGTVNRRLMSFLDPFTPPNPTPIRGVRTADVTVDPARNLWFRLFLPTDTAPGVKLPVIVFFHGGGFAFLSPANRVYDLVCRRLAAKMNAVVASVNYRLSPEHKFPAPYIDGVDVLRYIDDPANASPDLDSADASNCFLMGDSAGGNIAHHVARRWLGGDGGWKRVRLTGLIVVQPYFGGEERTEAEVRLKGAPLVSVERTDWLWRAFLPEGADRDHGAANVFGPEEEGELGEGFPAAMVVVGGWDPLQDWQRRYAAGLKARGKEARLVEYEDAVHAFYVFPELKEGRLLFEEIKEFIRSHRIE